MVEHDPPLGNRDEARVLGRLECRRVDAETLERRSERVDPVLVSEGGRDENEREARLLREARRPRREGPLECFPGRQRLRKRLSPRKLLMAQLATRLEQRERISTGRLPDPSCDIDRK